MQDMEKWTPLHPDTLTAPELEKISSRLHTRLSQIYSGLWLLRREKPLVFCLLMSAFFLALAALGCKVSAPGLVHGSCLLSFLLPPLVLRLTRNKRSSPVVAFIGDVLSSLSCLLVYRGSTAAPQEHHDLDDFMPEESAETLQSLEVQERFQSFLSSEPEDSLSLSLAADLRIPSHEEVLQQEMDSYSSSPRDLELDLLPTNPLALQQMPDSDSSEDEEEMAGPLGQLRGVEDSSDSDSELMPQLRLREAPTVTARLTAVGSSVTSMLPSMTSVLGNLVSSGRGDSSEPELEDFELISEDDLSNETPYL